MFAGRACTCKARGARNPAMSQNVTDVVLDHFFERSSVPPASFGVYVELTCVSHYTCHIYAHIIYIYIYIHVDMHMHTCVLRVYTCTYTYIHIHIQIYIYIYTLYLYTGQKTHAKRNAVLGRPSWSFPPRTLPALHLAMMPLARSSASPNSKRDLGALGVGAPSEV